MLINGKSRLGKCENLKLFFKNEWKDPILSIGEEVQARDHDKITRDSKRKRARTSLHKNIFVSVLSWKPSVTENGFSRVTISVVSQLQSPGSSGLAPASLPRLLFPCWVLCLLGTTPGTHLSECDNQLKDSSLVGPIHLFM